MIEGLASDSVCPECGSPIAPSLPGRRTGSPMQKRPGLRSGLVTAWSVVRRPFTTLDVMAVVRPRIRGILLLAALPIGQLLGVGLLLAFEAHRPLPGGGSVAWSPGSAVGSLALGALLGLLLTPVAAGGLALLTWIEARGLVVFGARSGSRMHPELAHAIVRHGAAGWLVTGLGAALVLPLAWSFEMEVGPTLGRPPFGDPPAWIMVLAALGILLCLLGFLFFEFFAWLGLRRCRFANSPRPHADRA